MKRLIDLLLDILAPKSWEQDLRNKRFYRRRKGEWEYRPMTDKEYRDAIWWNAIR